MLAARQVVEIGKLIRHRRDVDRWVLAVRHPAPVRQHVAELEYHAKLVRALGRRNKHRDAWLRWAEDELVRLRCLPPDAPLVTPL